ncbi:hypothetical protein METBIDRAFT_11991 [Metschnikowia bicuspidata var. bicuspidata NRRL YB-4993]|uniref:Uncharacterized protein n=1 Tax=Metschnikowia bicuspidata var. bicuspidata NRRL YB-4993 TaxID=869754 RepID=A0A1A0HC90_9ASCO|nr:hypothetical protein METBIDRAFT_11991 [Metschnikowia bicuspidata var. bicuspidata NRRL YB-4993]OBA21487.1 hypothetical protein METBIDRAFT_11991 [Metschnikowia bicuspidata var. bicuspidata NRRL YB-4993]
MALPPPAAAPAPGALLNENLAALLQHLKISLQTQAADEGRRTCLEIAPGLCRQLQVALSPHDWLRCAAPDPATALRLELAVLCLDFCPDHGLQVQLMEAVSLYANRHVPWSNERLARICGRVATARCVPLLADFADVVSRRFLAVSGARLTTVRTGASGAHGRTTAADRKADIKADSKTKMADIQALDIQTGDIQILDIQLDIQLERQALGIQLDVQTLDIHLDIQKLDIQTLDIQLDVQTLDIHLDIQTLDIQTGDIQLDIQTLDIHLDIQKLDIQTLDIQLDIQTLDIHLDIQKLDIQTLDIQTLDIQLDIQTLDIHLDMQTLDIQTGDIQLDIYLDIYLDIQAPHPKTPHPKTPHPKTPHPKTPHPKTPHPKTPHPKTPHTRRLQTRHTKMRPASPALGLRLRSAAEESERAAWKTSPDVTALASAVLLMACDDTGQYAAACAAFVLNVLDDADPLFRAQGCFLLQHMVALGHGAFLARRGLLAVFAQAVETCLTYLPQLTPAPVSLRLLRDAAYPALLAVLGAGADTTYEAYWAVLDGHLLALVRHVLGRHNDAPTNAVLAFLFDQIARLVLQNLRLAVLAGVSRLNAVVCHTLADAFVLDSDNGALVVDAALRVHAALLDLCAQHAGPEPKRLLLAYRLDLLASWAILARRVVKYAAGTPDTARLLRHNVARLREVGVGAGSRHVELDLAALLAAAPALRDVLV